MAAFSARERKLVLYALTAVSASLLYYGALIPFVKRNAMLDRSIAALQARIHADAELLGRKDTISSRFQELFSPSGGGLSEDGSILTVLTEIESIAGESGVRVQEIRPQEQAARSSFGPEQYVTLRLTADTAAYVRFLYALGRSASLFRTPELYLVYNNGRDALEGVLTVSRLSARENDEN